PQFDSSPFSKQIQNPSVAEQTRFFCLKSMGRKNGLIAVILADRNQQRGSNWVQAQPATVFGGSW
ncbi:MAG: hypothetical protein Q4D43_07355, partial [Clostridia bacterium]|nr:hypothetical protein [Clostridia bacterium]